MKHHFKIISLFLFSFFVLTNVLYMHTSKKPVLFGKISLKAYYGLKPLQSARVELLEIVVYRGKEKPGKVLYRTYTSSRGNFAFYNIPRGKYYLRVLLSKQILLQIKGKTRNEVSSVEVVDPRTSIRLPDIIVFIGKKKF